MEVYTHTMPLGTKLPPILDACCGGRMFWFDKKNPNVLFADIRSGESHELTNGTTLVVNPDVQHDFRAMPYPDNAFHLVVFDPPHMRAGEKGWMAKKYGSLEGKTWKETIRAGVDECFRVLRPNGVLIFKWNETHYKVSQVIEAIGRQPLFGHKTMQNNKTMWMAFMKLETKE
jgi:SAM-dependent methyltransferase